MTEINGAIEQLIKELADLKGRMRDLEDSRKPSSIETVSVPDSNIETVPDDASSSHGDIFKSVFDSLDFSIFVIDASGDGKFRFAGVNPTFEKKWGVTSAVAVGSSPLELVGKLNRASVELLIKNLCACEKSRSPVEYEDMVRSASGDSWWLTKLIPLPGPPGSPLRVVGKSSNITDWKQFELALNESNDSLVRRDAILQSVGFAGKQFLLADSWEDNIKSILKYFGTAMKAGRVCIFENFDHQGGISTCARHEWTHSDLPPFIGKASLSDFAYKRNGFARWITEMESGNSIFGKVSDFPSAEKRFLTELGISSIAAVPVFVNKKWWGFIWFDLSGQEFTLSSIEVEALKTATVLIGTAIHHKNIEDALLTSEKRYHDLIELSNEGFWLLDNMNKTIFANRRMTEILGYSVEEMINRDIFFFMDEKTAVKWLPYIESAKQGMMQCQECELIHKNGLVVFARISMSALTDEKGSIVGLFSLITDMTHVVKLEEEIKNTKKEILDKSSFHDLIGRSQFMRDLFNIIPTVSEIDCNVLIEGPSGTGKSLIAKTIHDLSARSAGPFVVINCGALPETLLESELFGYVKGAFTDARQDKPGKFAAASQGTIFLDEIGEIPIHLQVKLLRVIEEKRFEPLGTNKTQTADVRVIAATNKDLSKLIEQGSFREDLYYRLKVVHFKIPPLRERREDIEILTGHFIETLNKKYFKNITRMSMGVREFLAIYDYPGNVRELQNILEYAYIFCKSDTITVEDFSPEYKTRILGPKAGAQVDYSRPQPLELVTELSEKSAIAEALKKCGGNRNETAKYLNINRTQLWRKMKKYDLI